MRSFAPAASPPSFLEARRAQLVLRRAAPAAVDYILAALWCASARADPGALWADTSGWRLGAPAAHALALRRARGDPRAPERAGRIARASRTRSMRLRVIARDERALEAEIRGSRERRARRRSRMRTLELFRTGRHVSLRRSAPRMRCSPPSEADAGSLVTPLPGTVVAVHVTRRAERRARRAADHDRGHENGAHRGGPLRGHGGAAAFRSRRSRRGGIGAGGAQAAD